MPATHGKVLGPPNSHTHCGGGPWRSCHHTQTLRPRCPAATGLGSEAQVQGVDWGTTAGRDSHSAYQPHGAGTTETSSMPHTTPRGGGAGRREPGGRPAAVAPQQDGRHAPAAAASGCDLLLALFRGSSPSRQRLGPAARTVTATVSSQQRALSSRTRHRRRPDRKSVV